MKAQNRFEWMTWIAMTVCVAMSPAHAGQIVQSQHFDHTLKTIGVINDNILDVFGFDSFPEVTGGLGSPESLTGVVWRVEGTLAIGFAIENVTDGIRTAGSTWGIDWFRAPGVPPIECCLLLDTISTTDTCLPDDLCFGFAQKPFDRTWVADLSCVGVFCATNQYVASAANIFAQMNFHIFPANYRWEEGEEPPTWPWPLPDKVAQGFFFGTVTLTYFYAPEPGSIALLSIAIASLGFTRRRKLHRVTL